MTGPPLSRDEFLARAVDAGILSTEASTRLAAVLNQSGQPLDRVASELGVCREDELADAYAKLLGYPRQTNWTSTAEFADDATGRFLKDKALLPTLIDEETIDVTIADPFDAVALATLAFHYDRTPIVRVGERSRILTALAEAVPAKDELQEDQNDDGFDRDLERLRETAQEAPVIRFVQRIITEAVDNGATDIHVEPHEDHLRIRQRRDGMLHLAERAPRSLHAGIVTRIKIMAQLNIAERRLPQDGRMRVPVRGENVDLRVSVVPALHGETIAIRILDRSAIPLDLDALGFDRETQTRLAAMMNLGTGLFLVTGPTGSGKTTTLYALLRNRIRPDSKIFTVEDPIEYRIDGITQMQIDPAIDLDFARALRATLRQGPNVILVGEIRDRETAEIAIRAALTGHLVLSTLHTNSAAGAVTRLRDMGVEDYLLASTVRGVLAQRLVRRCCPTCNGGAEPGCSACGQTGFSGRVAVWELLSMTEALSEAIADGASEQEVTAKAGMRSMRECAAELARAGITTEAEIRRVLEAYVS